MLKSHWIFGFAIFLSALANQAAGERPAAERTLTLRGTVVLPDGAPAREAVVLSWGNNIDRHRPISAQTDKQGRFEIQSAFGWGCKLHVRSADSSHQATLLVSPEGDRLTIAKPVEVKLQPARQIAILVLRDGKPVKDAQVVASGTVDNEYHVHGQTSADGKVRLAVPHGKLSDVAAWHNELGVDGCYAENGITDGVILLQLRPARTHRFYAVDVKNKPIANIKLGAHIGIDKDSWIMTRDIPQANVTTDSGGLASVSWMPQKDIRYLDCDVFDSQWTLDGIEKNDPKKPQAGETTLYLRRKIMVQGRLKMPAGASAEGILVSGTGFGPRNRGDCPVARAEADGSFYLPIATDYGYSIRVVDSQWASDGWTGLVLTDETARPAAIELEMYPATPCKIKVNFGDAPKPLVNAWVEVAQPNKAFKWRDASGAERSCIGGKRFWTRTNDAGIVKTGVPRGKITFAIRQNGWDEEQEIRVQNDKPIEVSIALPPPIFGERPPKPQKILNLD